MTEAGRQKLPIGYWLKQVDTLLTEQINQAHHASGITRVEWQLLQSLHQQGPLARETLLDTLRAFVDAPALELTLGRLQARGWIAEQAETASLASHRGGRAASGQPSSSRSRRCVPARCRASARRTTPPCCACSSRWRATLRQHQKGEQGER